MVQQLTIFDVLPQKKEFKFGNPVKVIEINEQMDDKAYYYLSLFTGKRGLIAKVIRQPTLLYEVDFDGKIAIIYHEELEGQDEGLCALHVVSVCGVFSSHEKAQQAWDSEEFEGDKRYLKTGLL